jgi:hypothetical protein
MERVRMSFALALIRRSRRTAALAGIVCIACVARAEAQSIRGRVIDERGVAVPHADVQALPDGRAVLTDSAGRFDLGPLPAGTDSIRVRRVGYDMTIARVIVPLVSPRLTIVLHRSAAMLDTVHTSALEQRLPRLFVREREHLGASLYGPALDSMFARGGSRSLWDKLTIDGRFSRKIHTSGPFCMYVDGILVRGLPEAYINENEISAIEVFNSDAFVHEPFIDGAPLHLVGGKLIRRCGVLVLVWSKYYQQPPWGGH